MKWADQSKSEHSKLLEDFRKYKTIVYQEIANQFSAYHSQLNTVQHTLVSNQALHKSHESALSQ